MLGELTFTGEFVDLISDHLWHLRAQVLKEALRKQTRHVAMERDMAMELRQAAERETVRSRMKAEASEAMLRSAQGDCEAEVNAMREQLDRTSSERDEAVWALEKLQNAQNAVELELREELSRALDQVVTLKQDCKELKSTAAQLEHKLEKSSERESALHDELRMLREQAIQGTDLKKQLAASLLSALDMPYPA